ncbi:hypothetical protein BV898_18854 [Hypsibius exemplaris]|uniref:Tyr recombinase domain-containing protein n=1 Tax=Hypsibius exemplaris TaxID=2072580 RepID=A0A9X6NIH7_HYPEX|nr:hypothetical protein BV898_18854 [Hypsibius exemplaris]
MELKRVVAKLLHNHISPTSRKTYSAGLRKLQQFCLLYNIHSIPLTQDHILSFIAYLYALGEFCTSSETTFGNDDHALLYSNVSILADGSISCFHPHSKTDIRRNGQIVTLTATNRSVCPVSAASKFLKLRAALPTGRTPLFTFPDGSFLSRRFFSNALKVFLRHVPHRDRYSSHSFRIGAATSAAENSIAENVIQKAGRWKSSAYRGYIRIQSPARRLKFYP